MIRTVLLGLLWFIPGFAQQGQLDASPSLFSVLAAINTAGYDAEVDSPNNHPLRQALREHLAKQKLASVEELKRFFREHRQRDANAELTQYISWALVVAGPPDFKPLHPEQPMPPDAAALEGLAPLVARFCKEANLDALWRQAQPLFDKAIDRYHQPVTRALMEVNAYLRNPTSGYLGRRFQIYVDLLGAPNQVHTRSYGDDYFIVITPAPEPPIDDIRHGYLHYVLDPLALKFSEQLDKKRGLIDYAQGSPILEDYYKNDFNLLATECLIKAVESRLSRKPALVEQALREGLVVTPAFAEALAAYEKQEVAMRLYFPELVAAIDLKREERRLEKVEFASERAARKVRVVPAERKVELTGAAKTLEDAEKQYRDRDLPRAKETYLRALKETDQKPLHARAYYGLARIAALAKDPEMAQKLFRKTLELEPDVEVKSWSLLYLARLADAQGERERAQQHYQAALAVEGAPATVREAAEKGLKEAFTKK